MIFLYRAPLLHYCARPVSALDAIVRNTLIHEIGHFGYSDDDMDRSVRPIAARTLISSALQGPRIHDPRAPGSTEND